MKTRAQTLHDRKAKAKAELSKAKTTKPSKSETAKPSKGKAKDEPKDESEVSK